MILSEDRVVGWDIGDVKHLFFILLPTLLKCVITLRDRGRKHLVGEHGYRSQRSADHSSRVSHLILAITPRGRYSFYH